MADAHREDPDHVDLTPLLALMAKLRAPDGCPWDREQTHSSLKRYLLEEAYELLDAIDAGDDDAFVDELGDVLLQVVFHAQIAAEAGRFTMKDVVDGLHDKLIRRHPHVFGDAKAEDTQAVARLWADVKRAESLPGDSAAPGTISMLENVSRSLPALMEAEKIQRRAARVGFEWDDVDGAWAKVREELDELEAAMTARTPASVPARSTSSSDPSADAAEHRAAIEEEWGDVLFALVNVARYVDIDPEQSLRAANAKFRRRFAHIETRAHELGRRLEQMSLEEMDALWDESKRGEDEDG